MNDILVALALVIAKQQMEIDRLRSEVNALQPKEAAPNG